MLAGLKQFHVRSQVLPRLNGLDIPQDEIAVDKPVQGRFLARVLAITKAFFHTVDAPGNLFKEKGLPLVAVNKANLHPRREMVVHYRPIGLFHVFFHGPLRQLLVIFPQAVGRGIIKDSPIRRNRQRIACHGKSWRLLPSTFSPE